MNRKALRVLLDHLGLRLLTAFNAHLGDDIERLLRTCARAPVRIGTTLVLIGFLGGGLLFSIFEKDADLIDGLYWATVVMPTVGFGDFSPETVAGRWVYELVVFCGIFGQLLIGGAFVGAIAARRLQHHQATPELDDDFDDVIHKLEDLKSLTNDPRVKQALREAHNERNPPCPGS